MTSRIRTPNAVPRPNRTSERTREGPPSHLSLSMKTEVAFPLLMSAEVVLLLTESDILKCLRNGFCQSLGFMAIA